MAKKNLILTVGLPRSGKSTWAHKSIYDRNAVVVNPDSVRLAIHGQAYIREAEGFVWATVKAMVKALFLAGHTEVIIDATNLKEKGRGAWWCDDWTVLYKVFDADSETCMQRARDSNREDLIPVIIRMADEYEELTPVEWEEAIL